MKWARRLEVAMGLVYVALVVGGCGWFGGPIQVDPVVLNEVRRIGVVRGESKVQSDVNRRAEITNFFVIDVAGVNASDTLDKAVKNLQAQKWSIITENRPIRVVMKSDKWPEVHLTIASFDAMYLEEAPELRGMLGDKTPTTEGHVIIDVYKFA
ncbi:hypothetical protein [Nonomuraea sp. 10N515B]|uniref:hypothetical protein n=1 Tax=Nonomuraea sp. 10N515B TaxID=3457422 RepID=UPI003FCE630C